MSHVVKLQVEVIEAEAVMTPQGPGQKVNSAITHSPFVASAGSIQEAFGEAILAATKFIDKLEAPVVH